MFIMSLFSVVGIIYILALTLCSFGKGLLFMWFWSIVLLVCSFYGGLFAETNGVYDINSGGGIPVWIFNPEVLIMGPILATCMSFIIFVASRQAKKEGG